MKKQTEFKLKDLIQHAFKEAVDKTLVTLLTSDHPGKEGWNKFIDKEWGAAEDYLFNKLNRILDNDN